MRVLGRDFVREHLTYPAAIALVREGMIALSRQDSIQPLRSILRMAAGRMFGVMPGALGDDSDFGAKLVSVFPGNAAKGLQSHQGGILMFDPESGMPTALVHAGTIAERVHRGDEPFSGRAVDQRDLGRTLRVGDAHRLNARDLFQRLADVRRAGVAGHAGDLELCHVRKSS